MKFVLVFSLCGLLVGTAGHVAAATIQSDYLSILDRTTTPPTPIPIIFIAEPAAEGVEAPISYTSTGDVLIGGGGITAKSVYLTDPDGSVSDVVQETNIPNGIFTVFTITMYSDVSTGITGGTPPGGALVVPEANCQVVACDLTRLLFSETSVGKEPLQVAAWSDLDIVPPPPPPPSSIPEPSTGALIVAPVCGLIVIRLRALARGK